MSSFVPRNGGPSGSSSRTATFLPLPPRSLAKPPPEYHQPVLIGTYSHLSNRSIAFDDSSMAYYRSAPIGADLNYGFDTRIERDESVDEHLDGLCDFLQHHGEQGGKVERKGGVITWRGMITRIMTAPFEEREGWEMTALALDGSVYVELHDPPDLRSKRWNEQSAWAMQSYMGYAYESYSTTGEGEGGDGPEGWGGNVNINVQWCKSAIGDIPLCLGGEVDCVDAPPGEPHPGLEKCMELKTNKVIENDRQEAVFHKKLLKHWAQSWLLGVPTVEVGFRDDSGILKGQRTFETLKIPRFIAATPNPLWNPSPAHHFLHAVLELVTSHVLPTDPKPPSGLPPDAPLPPAMVWRFGFVPRRGCELYRVGPVGLENGRWGGVLQEKYVRWRMSR